MKFFHVCLVVLLAFRMSEAAAQNMDTDSERARKVWTEHFRDDENLRNDLLDEFTATDGADWEGIDKLTRCYSVSEDRLRSAAMSLFEEATNLSSDGASHKDGVPLRLLANNALFLLGKYADNTTKSFLLNLVADKSRDGVLRTVALSSYLHAADAEEATGALLRFLVSPDRMVGDMERSGAYAFANTAWNESSSEKKRAICEALQAGLAHESTHWVFCSGDRWLCGMSAKYARSEERLAMFERMYATPVPDGDLFDRQSLVPQIEMLRKLKKHTSVNTNLATAIAHDFNQPLPEEERIALETPPNAPDATDAAQEKSTETGRKSFYALAAIAGLLGVLALWFGLRRKRGPA